MAQQQLQTQIILSGRIDSSFGPLAAALDGLANKTIALASGINQVSQPILRTGKEVTKLYAGFDDAMRYIQAVSDLTEQQLYSVEKAARSAGKTTRYSATSSAEALAYGAEAGLEYKENIELLPDVLNMAAAGNMELETAMDQLLTILYSTGTPLSEAGKLIDTMAMAASSSKTDIESMGEAVTRLGGISRYAKGGTSELLTLLAMLAQRGQEGSEAGTYLRNVMLALVAPTKSAAEVMQELNASEEELEEALDGISVTNAAKRMDELGLHVYDTATGKLRPMIDILWDLKAITDKMSDEQRNKVLGDLFPKRTLAAVTNLMGELDTSYERIADAINNAEGAAKRMADTRESGIGGALRLLSNAADELRLSFGEELADRITLWAGSLRDLALSISEMPVAAKNFLIDVASAVAFMGPAAMFAGLALKGLGSIIAFIGTPFGAVVTGIVALGLLWTHLENMARADKANAINRNFGVIEVSSEQLAKAVQSLDGGMGAALNNLDKYGEAVGKAGDEYKSKLGIFSSDILSAVVFGQTISPAQAAKLYQLGDDMASITQSGIRARQIQISDFVSLLFADKPEMAISIKGTLDSYFDGLYRESINVGESIRQKIAQGLEGDNELDANEWAAIRAEVDRLNEIQAKIQSITNAAEVEATLQKGMRLGFDAAGTTMGEFAKQRTDVEERTYALLDETIGYIIASEKEADKEGKGQYTDEELEAVVRDARQRAEGLLIENSKNSNEASVRFMETIFQGHFSDLWGYGNALNQEVAQLMLDNPGVPFENLVAEAVVSGKLPEVDTSTFTAFKAWWPQMEALLPEVEAAKAWYTGKGEAIPEWITNLEQMKAMAQIILGSDPKNLLEYTAKDVLGFVQGDEYTGQYKDASEANIQKRDSWETAFWEQFNGLLDSKDRAFWDSFSVYHEQNKGRITDIPDYITSQDDIYNYVLDILLDEYLEKIGEAKPSGSLIHDTYGDLVTQAGDLGEESANAYNSSFLSGIGETTEYFKPRFGGGGSNTREEFANGGRAVEAAIFGEAGPEWAIPESHTERTAELLNSARIASGFSWPELIAANGGLGGGGNTYHYSRPVYAPVIYASDAKGVQEVLREDKRRFDEWWKDKQEEMERSSWS